MLDFWRYAYSRLENLHSTLAEFLVSRALGIGKAENTGYWAAYDMTYRGKRIEVKETSYVHPWNEKRVSPARVFSIAPSSNAYWALNGGRGLSRQSDIYVFCFNMNKEIAKADPLNMGFWRFYLVPTERIDAYAEQNGNPGQKTISLRVVQRLAGQELTFGQLKEAVDALIDRHAGEN